MVRLRRCIRRPATAYLTLEEGEVRVVFVYYYAPLRVLISPLSYGTPGHRHLVQNLKSEIQVLPGVAWSFPLQYSNVIELRHRQCLVRTANKLVHFFWDRIAANQTRVATSDHLVESVNVFARKSVGLQCELA